jgi:hypothetical protein
VICFSLYAQTRKNDIPLGWVSMPLFSFQGAMATGPRSLLMPLSGEAASPLAHQHV